MNEDYALLEVSESQEQDGAEEKKIWVYEPFTHFSASWTYATTISFSALAAVLCWYEHVLGNNYSVAMSGTLGIFICILILHTSYGIQKTESKTPKSFRDEADWIQDKHLHRFLLASVLICIFWAFAMVVTYSGAATLNERNFFGPNFLFLSIQSCGIITYMFHRIVRPADRFDPLRTILELDCVDICFDALDSADLYQSYLLTSVPPSDHVAVKFMIVIWMLFVGLRLGSLFLVHLSTESPLSIWHRINPRNKEMQSHATEHRARNTVNRTLVAADFRLRLQMMALFPELFAAFVRLALYIHTANGLQSEAHTQMSEFLLKNVVGVCRALLSFCKFSDLDLFAKTKHLLQCMFDWMKRQLARLVQLCCCCCSSSEGEDDQSESRCGLCCKKYFWGSMLYMVGLTGGIIIMVLTQTLYGELMSAAESTGSFGSTSSSALCEWNALNGTIATDISVSNDLFCSYYDFNLSAKFTDHPGAGVGDSTASGTACIQNISVNDIQVHGFCTTENATGYCFKDVSLRQIVDRRDRNIIVVPEICNQNGGSTSPELTFELSYGCQAQRFSLLSDGQCHSGACEKSGICLKGSQIYETRGDCEVACVSLDDCAGYTYYSSENYNSAWCSLLGNFSKEECQFNCSYSQQCDTFMSIWDDTNIREMVSCARTSDQQIGEAATQFSIQECPYYSTLSLSMEVRDTDCYSSVSVNGEKVSGECSDTRADEELGDDFGYCPKDVDLTKFGIEDSSLRVSTETCPGANFADLRAHIEYSCHASSIAAIMIIVERVVILLALCLLCCFGGSQKDPNGGCRPVILFVGMACVAYLSGLFVVYRVPLLFYDAFYLGNALQSLAGYTIAFSAASYAYFLVILLTRKSEYCLSLMITSLLSEIILNGLSAADLFSIGVWRLSGYHVWPMRRAILAFVILELLDAWFGVTLFFWSTWTVGEKQLAVSSKRLVVLSGQVRAMKLVVDFGSLILRVILWWKYGIVQSVYLMKNIFNLMHTGAVIERGLLHSRLEKDGTEYETLYGETKEEDWK